MDGFGGFGLVKKFHKKNNVIYLKLEKEITFRFEFDTVKRVRFMFV